MSNLIKRIQNRMAMTSASFKGDCIFSKKLAVYRLLDDICWRFRLRHISNIFHAKKDQKILEYLKDELKDIIEKYRNNEEIGESEKNAPIWVCWWDGEEHAPALVKQCMNSIRKNAGQHPVRFISKNTYQEYIDIPEYILDKVSKGQMCIANFSDYLRVSLLEKFGGLWLDATIYCSSAIPERYFEKSIFTCKSNPVESRYISRYRWTSFCLGGWKHHVFYRFFKEALETYWKQEEQSIDYLLVDYLIEIAYSNIPTVKKCFDEVEINNLHRDDLQAAMNAALPAEEFSKILNKDTVLYKLSWREHYELKTVDGRESVYSYFIKLRSM